MSRPVISHLGLGDMIVQSGAMVALAEKYGDISVLCYDRYKASIESFYANYPQISVFTVAHQNGYDWGSPPDSVIDSQMSEEGFDFNSQLRGGVYAGRGIGWDFTKSFYEHFGFPYSYRWDKCPLQEAANKVEQLPLNFPGQKKVFIHDDPIHISGKNFIVNRLVDRRQAICTEFNDFSKSILQYKNIIESADEIHVIDSAFFWLVNAFNPRGQLFLHCYARWPRSHQFRYESRQNWEYIF